MKRVLIILMGLAALGLLFGCTPQPEEPSPPPEPVVPPLSLNVEAMVDGLNVTLLVTVWGGEKPYTGYVDWDLTPLAPESEEEVPIPETYLLEHTYDKAGTYVIGVYVTDSGGRAASEHVTVTVEAPEPEPPEPPEEPVEPGPPEEPPPPPPGPTGK